MFPFRRKHQVKDMVDEYLETAGQCVDKFVQGFEALLSQGRSAQFDRLVEECHRAEAACDDIRRRVEGILYEKALIPQSRGDVLGLLESLDHVPNKADHTLRTAQDEALDVPGHFAGQVREIVKVNAQAFQSLREAVRCLFEDIDEVRTHTREVDEKESVSDVLERKLIRTVFRTPDVAGDQRILLRDLIHDMGGVSDRCENVADRLIVLAVKRLV